MDFGERLGILVSGGVISADVEQAVRQVIRNFRERWGVELNEENGGRMVTHLAMALMRVKANDEVGPLEQEQFAEFQSSAYFSRAAEITAELCGELPWPLPRAEREYLIINICLILDELNEG